MTFRRLLAPLLGAAFLMIAALFGAGVANAHPGHAHTGAVAAPAAAAVEAAPAVDEATVAIALAESATEEAGRPAPSEIRPATALHFEVAIEAGRGAPDAPCRGMCCDNTPCGGCVKMAFGKTSLPAPLLGAFVLASVEARKLAGRLAEGPNEPPRPFI
jgi:hypothetical protein